MKRSVDPVRIETHSTRHQIPENSKEISNRAHIPVSEKLAYKGHN